ncbi:uncharacterized protein LOC133892158 [Phragmites australis]|uniref:uncharacterized protein LOC133892158 n=1 Tax=Phragmites australis TaxID=29695 RepID=UPI002D76B62B|nr:uncharacterized protein LOC133892158 [Phragmites australis]
MAGPQRPEGQSPPLKRGKADTGPKPQGLEFKILESRWQYRGPKSTPPKDAAGDQRRPEARRPAPAPEPSAPAPEPSAPAKPKPQALPYPELRAAAAPEQPAPAEPALSPPRAGQVATVRVAPTWQQSGTPSASAERARRGLSARPSSSQAAERLPDVIGSAQKVIERLEAAVAGERA